MMNNGHNTGSDQNRRSREVRFAESPPVEIEHPELPSEADDDDEYDDDTLWYSRDQVRSMVAEQRTDIIRFSVAFMRMATAPMANNNVIITDDQRIQMLGLESYVPLAVAQSVALNRNMHRASVLNEQERQDRSNVDEADTLRRVSERYSRAASHAAHHLAVRFSNIR